MLTLEKDYIYYNYISTKLITILFCRGLREKTENQIYSLIKLLKLKAKITFGFALVYQLFESLRPLFGLKAQTTNPKRVKKNKKIRPTYIYYRLDRKQSYNLAFKWYKYALLLTRSMPRVKKAYLEIINAITSQKKSLL